MKTRHLRNLLALLTLLIASAGKAENDTLPDTLVTGPVKVIDGDSILVAAIAKPINQASPGTDKTLRQWKIRLRYIDAPEMLQLCKNPETGWWGCGATATNQLREKLGIGELNIQANWHQDVLAGRTDLPKVGCSFSLSEWADIKEPEISAECIMFDKDGGPIHLNSYMAGAGWATLDEEGKKKDKKWTALAQAMKIGIWSGQFIEPSEWRKGKRLPR